MVTPALRKLLLLGSKHVDAWKYKPFLMKPRIVSMNSPWWNIKINNALDSTLLTNATGHLVDKAARRSGCRAVTVRIHSHAPHSLEFCFEHLDAICFVPIFQVAIISVTVHSGMAIRVCVIIPMAVRLDTLILVVSGEVQLQQKKNALSGGAHQA